MVMAGAMVAGAAAAAAAILALMTTTQHDRLGEECDAVVAPAAQECAVCLCELAGAAGCSKPEAAAAAVRTLPGCGHGFHAECIGRWLPLRAECPILPPARRHRRRRAGARRCGRSCGGGGGGAGVVEGGEDGVRVRRRAGGVDA
uniref:RING-type E3 ubiquitin transferase n=1 Tax=Oryza barthii TaxID=65489 RepID=A0A0D3FJH6_9ORYZ